MFVAYSNIYSKLYKKEVVFECSSYYSVPIDPNNPPTSSIYSLINDASPFGLIDGFTLDETIDPFFFIPPLAADLWKLQFVTLAGTKANDQRVSCDLSFPLLTHSINVITTLATVTCNAGSIFFDETTEKTFTCDAKNYWEKVQDCVEELTKNDILRIDLVYTVGGDRAACKADFPCSGDKGKLIESYQFFCQSSLFTTLIKISKVLSQFQKFSCF
ncbi:hypothetical protein A3Q56_02478 [Intoshia linei]|uniref:Uncharacterized protein n=1 Tax=Intoshia linei TaxID=1819745 RepID=A0A177B862_9BILA|nr:hypothetical protein A3Q56_02478 [Intoshia linei]